MWHGQDGARGSWRAGEGNVPSKAIIFLSGSPGFGSPSFAAPAAPKCISYTPSILNRHECWSLRRAIEFVKVRGAIGVIGFTASRRPMARKERWRSIVGVMMKYESR